jgi:hypothetical protein
MAIKVCININSTQISEKHAVKYPRLIRSHGCVIRGNNMRRILEVGRDQWKLENGYGMRWKVECTFSDLKRILLDPNLDIFYYKRVCARILRLIAI